MKYSIKEIFGLTDEAALVYAWAPTRIIRSRRDLRAEYLKYVGTSTGDIREIENLPFDENGEADVEIFIYNKEDYENLFLANTSEKWPEGLNDDDKIAIIITK